MTVGVEKNNINKAKKVTKIVGNKHYKHAVQLGHSQYLQIRNPNEGGMEEERKENMRLAKKYTDIQV